MAKQQSTAISKREELRGSLEKMKPQFAMALPRHLDADKFMRVAQTAINQNPDLMDANRQTLFAACMQCAQAGLLPDNREAAFVVFGGKSGKSVVFMPMIGGILKTIRNSGELNSIGSYVVCEGDKFEHWVDEDGEHFKYEPADEQGDARLVFAFAKTKDGGTYFERMTIDQIEQVRQCSRAKDSGPWKQWWSEMARKTVIRRMAKRLPMSSDMDALIRADDHQYEVEEVDQVRVEGEPSRLKSIVEQQSKPTQELIHEPEMREPGDDTEIIEGEAEFVEEGEI